MMFSLLTTFEIFLFEIFTTLTEKSNELLGTKLQKNSLELSVGNKKELHSEVVQIFDHLSELLLTYCSVNRI